MLGHLFFYDLVGMLRGFVTFFGVVIVTVLAVIAAVGFFASAISPGFSKSLEKASSDVGDQTSFDFRAWLLKICLEIRPVRLRFLAAIALTAALPVIAWTGILSSYWLGFAIAFWMMALVCTVGPIVLWAWGVVQSYSELTSRTHTA